MTIQSYESYLLTLLVLVLIYSVQLSIRLDSHHPKDLKYKTTYSKLLHAFTDASFVGVISGVSTIGTAFTVVGLPISAALSVVSTVSTCVGGIFLLSSKEYKKKLLKCYELLDM